MAKLSRFFSIVLIAAFVNSSITPIKSYGATVLGLPEAGTMVNLTPAYTPVLIKGVHVHPNNPVLFDFIVDTGNSGLHINTPQLRLESEKLIKYFLATLAIPEQDLWVNLSPYEKERIINGQLGQTEMGRDMLAQDYVLKQLTASLIYPEKALGKKFWDKVYAQAQERFGNAQIPVNTFNKVWIMPDKAGVFVRNNTAFVVQAHLKVMLEEDYLSAQKHSAISANTLTHAASRDGVSSQIVREIVLPALEQEVNTGKDFANLRQIFYSLVLASWYKKNLKQALLNQVYSDKGKINGVDVSDKTIDQKIYQQYLEAYKKGVFNYIKEDVNASGQSIARRYFSGGEDWAKTPATNPALIANAAAQAFKPSGDMAIVSSTVDNAAGQAEQALQSYIGKIRLLTRTIPLPLSQLDAARTKINGLLTAGGTEAAKQEGQNFLNSLVYTSVGQYLKQARGIYNEAKQADVGTKTVAYTEIIGNIQKIIAMPEMVSVGAKDLQQQLNRLWIDVGNELEMDRINAIKDLMAQEGVQNIEERMAQAHVVFEKGRAKIEDLPPSQWAPYSAEIWAPYLNDSLTDLLRKTDVNLDGQEHIVLPSKIGNFQTADVQALSAKTDPVERLKDFVKLEGDVRKDPDKGLKLAEQLHWGEVKTQQDFQLFMQQFLDAMKWMKWVENWESKKEAFLAQENSRLEVLKQKLGLADMDTNAFGARILARNIPLSIIEKVAAHKMPSGNQYSSYGKRLLRQGFLRMVSMAGGSASRWKSSLSALIKRGIIDPNHIPDNLPRALAAYWWGNFQEGGDTGVSLMLNNLDLLASEGYKTSAAFVLSPFTWVPFMEATQRYFSGSTNKPVIDAIAQNAASAQVLENSALTGEDVAGKVLGHGNVRGWIPGVIEALKQGAVIDVTRSADSPFMQLNQRQSEEIVGRMAEDGLAHVALGNWRSIGQAGGGFVNQNGIPNLIDTVIPKKPNESGFIADRDINVFSSFTNFINNAALLYAVSSPEDNLITWDQVLQVTRGDETALKELKGRLEQLTPEQEARFTANFINLLPSEFVVKKEDKTIVQWEQISGMLHGALPKAIEERQAKEGITSRKPLSMAYVDISLADYKTLYSQEGEQVGSYVPTFIEVKGAGDLEAQSADAVRVMKVMQERGVFKTDQAMAADAVSVSNAEPAAFKPRAMGTRPIIQSALSFAEQLLQTKIKEGESLPKQDDYARRRWEVQTRQLARALEALGGVLPENMPKDIALPEEYRTLRSVEFKNLGTNPFGSLTVTFPSGAVRQLEDFKFIGELENNSNSGLDLVYKMLEGSLLDQREFIRLLLSLKGWSVSPTNIRNKDSKQLFRARFVYVRDGEFKTYLGSDVVQEVQQILVRINNRRGRFFPANSYSSLARLLISSAPSSMTNVQQDWMEIIPEQVNGFRAWLSGVKSLIEKTIEHEIEANPMTAAEFQKVVIQFPQDLEGEMLRVKYADSRAGNVRVEDFVFKRSDQANQGQVREVRLERLNLGHQQDRVSVFGFEGDPVSAILIISSVQVLGHTPGTFDTADRAMQHEGGIDFNIKSFNTAITGDQIQMHFDPALVAQFKRGDFTGLRPVILGIRPISSVLPMLGVAA